MNPDCAQLWNGWLWTGWLMWLKVEKKIFSACQSGFRKGRNMMDSILCLKAEIRKAQVNKEVLVGVFFDVEKAYDMLWKEGLLMKLERLRIDGKMYNWILSFLFGRTIQVRVGTAFSQILPIENGTPQGSVSSPILFNLMINDIYHNGYWNRKIIVCGWWSTMEKGNIKCRKIVEK